MRKGLRFILAGLFSLAGVMHFIRMNGFTRIVPKYLPLRKTAVIVTGIVELLIGGVLFWKRPSQAFKRGIHAFLISVFPANIYMARKQLPLGDYQLPKWALYGRLPLQFVLMAFIRKL
ncbi:DoxX family protein [Staphylococcus simulans]